MAEESESASSDPNNTDAEGAGLRRRTACVRPNFSRENFWRRKNALLAMLVTALFWGDIVLVAFHFLGKHR